MDFMGFFLSIFVLLLSSILTKMPHKLWWKPMEVQRAMASQGIKGPPYKFIHGCTKEISKLKKDVMMKMNKPIANLSNEIFPIVEPHLHKRNDKYDTEPVKEILNNRDKTYVKPEFLGDIKKFLGDGLVSTEGQKWARQRRLAHLAFHGESLKAMIPAVVDTVHKLLKRWQNLEAKEVELFEELTVVTSDVISRTAFGSSYIEGRNIFQITIWKTRDEIESERLEKTIRDAVLEIIKKREEKMNMGEKDEYRDDFSGFLVKAYHDQDESKRITIDDLVDECKTFYIAGQESTNTILTWSLFLLAIHRDWQEKARKEVTDVFGSEDPNHEGSMKLKTVGMIINESLRLYPPVVGIIRKVERQSNWEISFSLRASRSTCRS